MFAGDEFYSDDITSGNVVQPRISDWERIFGPASEVEAALARQAAEGDAADDEDEDWGD